VKAQLNAGYPVLIGVMADDGLIGLRRDAVWGAPSGTARGGHALPIVGYDDSKNAFRFMNSWGTGWPDGGFAWVDYTFFRSVVREAFVAKNAADTTAPGP